MRRIRLGGSSLARVWLVEPPDFMCEPEDMLEGSLDHVETMVVAEPQTVAIEVFWPRGGRADYGLLGAEFVPSEGKGLLVRVAVAQSCETRVSWSLAWQIDDVRAGLPRLYAENVLAEAIKSAEMVGSGTLSFRWAVHGGAGSFPILFRVLTRSVLGMLVVGGASLTDERIREILRNAWN